MEVNKKVLRPAMNNRPPLLQIMVTFGSLVAPWLMARMNTRPHLIAAMLVMSLAQGTFALTLLFPSISALSLPSVVLAGFCGGLGVNAVPYAVMSQLFPQKYKSLGVTAGQVSFKWIKVRMNKI